MSTSPTAAHLKAIASEAVNFAIHAGSLAHKYEDGDTPLMVGDPIIIATDCYARTVAAVRREVRVIGFEPMDTFDPHETRVWWHHVTHSGRRFVAAVLVVDN